MDRLRRLDALFAEKVLGYTTEPCRMELPMVYSAVQVKDGKREYLPHYTRSLDAAWEGVEKLTAEPRGLLMCLETGTSPIYKVNTMIGTQRWYFAAWSDCYPEECGETAYADHPAEALVLACLRVVGCSEEELIDDRD